MNIPVEVMEGSAEELLLKIILSIQLLWAIAYALSLIRLKH